MVDAARHRRVFLPVLGALVALAWVALWAWASTPYGRYMDHGEWTASGPAAFLCRVVPAGSVVVPAALYGAAWILMSTAMMLPSTLPLFTAFDRLVAQRADRARLPTLLGLGYLAAWGAFGLLAHVLHAALLAWVGSFVIEHWRGRSQAWQAFLLGAHHGLFCVGCCWALMLLMFAVGAGSLGWMLLLAAVMAIEKNLPWGRRLSAPLGVALLAWAALLVASEV